MLSCSTTYQFEGIQEDIYAFAEFDCNFNTFEWNFYDEDKTTLLATVEVEYGKIPTYPKEDLPTKESNQQYDYIFSSWDGLVDSATSNGNCYAKYRSSLRRYVASFYDSLGNFLYSTEVEYGKTAVYRGITPSKENTISTVYEFIGWDNPLTIYEDTDFIAQFSQSPRQYDVTFLNEDGSTLLTIKVDYNTTAIYTGATPKKNSDGRYNYTFERWNKSLQNITSDTTVTALYTSSINLDYLKFTLSNDNYYIVSLGDTSVKYSDFYIPDMYNNIVIKEIGNFSNSFVKNVHLPNTIEKINDYAFNSCTSLVNINLEEGLLYIGQKAFYGCSSLETLVFPSTTTTIQTQFLTGTKIKSIIIPENITNLSTAAFYDCTSLQSVTINANINELSSYMFNGCSSLSEVIIGEHITALNQKCFNGCSSLKTIAIPSNVTTIYGGAFEGCGLETIVIPETVISLGASAFNGCNTVKSVTINANITTLEMFLFSGCTSLNEVIIGEHITTIYPKCFYGCSSLKSIIIPSNVTTISGAAFEYCGLESIVIPETVTTLGASAFNQCSSLKTATINANITTLESYMFNGCSRLEEIIIGEHITSIAYNSFSELKQMVNIYINNIPANITSQIYDQYYFYSSDFPLNADYKWWHYVNGEIVIWDN